MSSGRPPLRASSENDSQHVALDSTSHSWAGNPTTDEYQVRTPNFKFERIMSSNELSYYLPSRADGANDTFVYFRFDCASGFITPQRINLAWAILRLRHPLCSCKVLMDAGEYDRVRFLYTAPSSPTEALVEARQHYWIFASKTREQLMDMCNNGPRILSNERPCFLFVTIPPQSSDSEKTVHDILLCYSHYSTDGLAGHYLGNELLSLLGGNSSISPSSPRPEAELWHMLEYEWERRWGKKQGSIYSPKGFKPVPSAAEERMGRDDRRLRKVAERVAFMNSLDKDAGGHVFPRIKPTSSARNSKIQTFIISQQHTRTILSLCKSHHATVTNAIFVLVTFAWLRLVASRTDPRNARISEAERKRWRAIGSERMPIMMYTAINLRPYIHHANPLPPESNIFLALGYLNVVLPGFLPRLALEQCESDEEARKVLERTFWLRVRSVRDQHTKVLSSPLFPSRNREMGKERAERAKAWAVIDDYEEEVRRRKMRGLPPPNPGPKLTTAKAEGGSRVAPKQPRVPSVALLGVSLLANLDNLYLPSNFPALNLFDILNGTRKNTGGILLMGYTFRGRIYSTLGWDSRSFEPGVVEEFFEKFEATLKEFLLPSVEGVVFERGLECRSKAAEQARL